ncbi:MAG: DUF6525 family protein [Pseudomonadota bacterium]
MPHNIGSTSLRRKRRNGRPMDAYDALPAPLRRWLSEAALPWSPTSARRIWNKANARGLSPEETLRVLAEAETKTLARDKQAIT